MIALKVQTAEVKHPLSPGQTRAVIRAYDDTDDKPAAIFLCCVEPPNSFERHMRESFQTVCSVEDIAEYPVGVSSISEIDPATQQIGSYLYAAQENKVYRVSEIGMKPAWVVYQPSPGEYSPNVHSHKLPFFRRSTIDIILPSRDFVVQAIGWIEQAVRQLNKAFDDLAKLKTYEE